MSFCGPVNRRALWKEPAGRPGPNPVQCATIRAHGCPIAVVVWYRGIRKAFHENDDSTYLGMPAPDRLCRRPRATTAGDPDGYRGHGVTGELYACEKAICQQGLGGTEKVVYRAEHARAAVDGFFAWAEEQARAAALLPSNPLTKALH